MNMSDSNTRYHIVPRASEDSDREASPDEQLLPSHSISPRLRRGNGPWMIDFHPVIGLRIFSGIFSLIVFIILAIVGGDEFIATDVFVMMILLLNVFQVINHCLTNILKVTVEFRRSATSMSLVSHTKPRISMYFDIGLSLCLIISLAVGGAKKSTENHYWYSNRIAWKVGYAFGWVVIALQLLLALPQLANKRLLLTAKLSDLNGEQTYTPAITSANLNMPIAADVESSSIKTEGQPIQMGNDLV